MGIQLSLRPAQQSDKESILKFCERTFDWGDYIPKVWDRWLLEKQAKLFTATLNNKPVGVMRVCLRKPGEAWLQAARTDPQYRRRGIATALTNTCLQWAVKSGAKIARLGTDSDNQVAQKVLTTLNFTRISDFLIMECEKLQTGEAENSEWAEMTDLEGVWRFLRNSKTFEASAGLYTMIFEWISLDDDDLRRFIVNKKAIVHKNGKVIDGLILIDEAIKDAWEEPAYQTCYIDGDSQSITDMVKFFKMYSHIRGMKKIYAFACNTPTIAKTLTESGFTREDPSTEFICQKELKQT